jgi:5'-phosphate synthase pdxT subunit
MDYSSLKVGVLALQGDFELHERQVKSLGATSVQVRLPKHLEGLDGLVMPGGESTTMDILMDRFKLREPLAEFGRSKAIYGTCAGMILLARGIADNKAGVKTFGLIDIDVSRNDYGRQIYSFDDELTARLDNREVRFRASFIRAPRIIRCGDGVEVLSRYRESPVLVRQNQILAASFHAELERDTTLLEYFFNDFLLPRR